MDNSSSFVPAPDPRPDDTPWDPLAWPLNPGTEVHGALVDLVPADPDRDAGELFSALDHEAVWVHVTGRPSSADDCAEGIRRAFAAGNLPWVLRLNRSYAGLDAGSVVGTSAFLDVSVPDARLEIGSTAYTPAVWGTAVNPDAKLALLTVAFELLGAGRVQLKTDVRNERSQRAIAALGARYEGTLRRYQRRTDGTIRDTAMFSVLAEEWPGVRDRLGARLAAAGVPLSPPELG